MRLNPLVLIRSFVRWLFAGYPAGEGFWDFPQEGARRILRGHPRR